MSDRDEEILELREVASLQQKILEEIASIKYGPMEDKNAPFGIRLADKVVKAIGSWRFMVIQGACLTLWILLNSVWMAMGDHWDPYPFILLNLVLSFQAAFTAPLILMAQNRADAKDRSRAENAYDTIDHIESMLLALVERSRMIEKNGTKDGNDGSTES